MKDRDPDERVYGVDGRAGWYQAKVPGGHLVAPIVADCDDEEYAAPAEIWPRVFNKAPKPKFDADIEALHAQIHELAAKRSKLEEACGLLLHNAAVLEKAKKSHAALAQAVMLLEKQVTHAVWHECSGPEVEATDLTDSDFTMECRSQHGRRSLFLWVKKSNDRSVRCTPAASEQEAHEIAKAALADALIEASQNGGNHYGLIKAAEKLDVPVPPKMLEAAAYQANRVLVQREDELRRAQDTLGQAMAHAAECQAKLVKPE